MSLRLQPGATTRRGWLVACLGGFAANACAPGSNLPPIEDAATGRYHIGVGDVVRLTTVGNEQLSGKFAVGDDGKVALPFVGGVLAAGFTTEELGARVGYELQRRKLFRNPSIAVEIDTYRPVFILGEINKPGLYPFFPGMTMLSLASVAGGFTYRAFTSYAAVVRIGGSHAVEGRIGRMAFVEPGDVVTIFERHF